MIPIIHQTDLFRPHEDPDDHWDLATVYAMAKQGLYSLEAVVIDSPPAHHNASPDALAVAQMNYITGLGVPFATGSPHRFEARAEPRQPNGAVRLILDVLESANEPVVISIAGSARDVAAASNQAPDLFARKCRAIYLNAGTGETPGLAGKELEYNVRLDEDAFRALFDVPCPLYWAPCFERLGVEWTVSEHGSWWKFQQSRIMDQMSPRLKNYFLSMFEQIQTADWLAHLERPISETVSARYASQDRNMWCTAGLLHAAGHTVNSSGQLIKAAAAVDSVFDFIPINAQCDESYVTSWTADRQSTDQFILKILDLDNYGSSMEEALRRLILSLD